MFAESVELNGYSVLFIKVFSNIHFLKSYGRDYYSIKLGGILYGTPPLPMVEYRADRPSSEGPR